MNKAILIRDNLDDRREVHRLLDRLPPWRRLQWLAWCCAQARLPNSDKRPGIQPGHSGLAMEVFLDFWIIVSQYQGLNVDAALERLVLMAKGKL